MKKGPQIVCISGWVIVHPSGYTELSYFNSQLDRIENEKTVTPQKWMAYYRPDCKLFKVTIPLDDNHAYFIPKKK